jgi:hypothetical protein
VIRGTTVVDVQQDTTTPGRDIVVRGGRIVDVAADASGCAPSIAPLSIGMLADVAARASGRGLVPTLEGARD